jgi:hypothetical protein
LVTALALAANAEMSLTVNQLIKFIQSAIQLKQPDRQVAEYLKHVKMVEKLDDQTIEDLQGQGAGPKTVAVLKDLGRPPLRSEKPRLRRRPSRLTFKHRRRIPSNKARSSKRRASMCGTTPRTFPTSSACR